MDLECCRLERRARTPGVVSCFYSIFPLDSAILLIQTQTMHDVELVENAVASVPLLYKYLPFICFKIIKPYFLFVETLSGLLHWGWSNWWSFHISIYCWFMFCLRFLCQFNWDLKSCSGFYFYTLKCIPKHGKLISASNDEPQDM